MKLLFSKDLHITIKDLTGPPLTKTLTGLQLILQQIVLLILLLFMERFVKRRKKTGLLQLNILIGLQTH